MNAEGMQATYARSITLSACAEITTERLAACLQERKGAERIGLPSLRASRPTRLEATCAVTPVDIIIADISNSTEVLCLCLESRSYQPPVIMFCGCSAFDPGNSPIGRKCTSASSHGFSLLGSAIAT